MDTSSDAVNSTSPLVEVNCTLAPPANETVPPLLTVTDVPAVTARSLVRAFKDTDSASSSILPHAALKSMSVFAWMLTPPVVDASVASVCAVMRNSPFSPSALRSMTPPSR